MGLTYTLAFQGVPTPPPRPAPPGVAPATPNTPAPAQPGVAAPEGQAPAQPPGGMFNLLLPLAMVGMVIFIFFSQSRQQKKQKEAIAELQKGDRVVTQSGIVGKLVETGERYAKIEIAPGVKIDVLRSTLLGKDTPEAAAAVEKK